MGAVTQGIYQKQLQGLSVLWTVWTVSISAQGARGSILLKVISLDEVVLRVFVHSKAQLDCFVVVISGTGLVPTFGSEWWYIHRHQKNV